jgi:aldose 1-epimerase
VDRTVTATPVRLEAGDARAVVDAAAGGRVTSLVVGPHELLVQNGADVFHWGSFPMAPWVGRLRDGRFRFGDEVVQLPRNAGRHALHGLVTDRPWTVTAADQRSVSLTVDLGSDAAESWPWPCRVGQVVSLAADRMEFRLELHAAEPMPADLGWHPWFNRTLRSTGGAVHAELGVSGGRIYVNDADGLPSGELGPPPARPWDYCFVELGQAPTVRWSGLLELTVESDCDHWVMYDMEPAGICVEPWTGPPNSLNGPAHHLVTPERPLTATMSWTWRSAD